MSDQTPAEQIAAERNAQRRDRRAEAKRADAWLDGAFDLLYRRAKFVYEGARLAAEAANAPIVPEPYDDREEAFRTQFEEVIDRQMGAERNEDAAALHQSWVEAYEAMGWVYGPVRDPEAKTHPDMVPYADLGHLERDKDAVFVALCNIARRWIHPDGEECSDVQ